jgi:hypothetical protein
MTQSVVKQFHAALIHLLSEKGRGAQTHLAKDQKIDRGHLNAIIKQRRPGSDKIREKIADHFNLSFEEMLSLGRRILSGEIVSTSEINRTPDVPLSNLHHAGQTTDLSECDDCRKQKMAGSSIPDKILQVTGILNSDNGYADLMSDFIGAVHARINTKTENGELAERLNEIDARLTILEKMLTGKI